MNKQVVSYLAMKFCSNTNQDFEKTTDSCLTLLHDKILKGFDDGLMNGMILIDLQKVFDAIGHNILLKKLSAIGFPNHTIGWFKSYLCNQFFRVNLGNCYSDPSNITCGVPQGSILGPLLFLIYMNHMPQAVKSNLLNLLISLYYSCLQAVLLPLKLSLTPFFLFLLFQFF